MNSGKKNVARVVVARKTKGYSKTLERVAKMSLTERFDSLVHAGIYNPSGTLKPSYSAVR